MESISRINNVIYRSAEDTEAEQTAGICQQSFGVRASGTGLAQ